MIVKLVWPDCKLINGEYGEITVDSFWFVLQRAHMGCKNNYLHGVILL